jgi:hypothetical protein
MVYHHIYFKYIIIILHFQKKIIRQMVKYESQKSKGANILRHRCTIQK